MGWITQVQGWGGIGNIFARMGRGEKVGWVVVGMWEMMGTLSPYSTLILVVKVLHFSFCWVSLVIWLKWQASDQMMWSLDLIPSENAPQPSDGNLSVVCHGLLVLCGSGFSSIGSVSVRFWIKTSVSVSILKPSQHYF